MIGDHVLIGVLAVIAVAIIWYVPGPSLGLIAMIAIVWFFCTEGGKKRL